METLAPVSRSACIVFFLSRTRTLRVQGSGGRPGWDRVLSRPGPWPYMFRSWSSYLRAGAFRLPLAQHSSDVWPLLWQELQDFRARHSVRVWPVLRQWRQNFCDCRAKISSEGLCSATDVSAKARSRIASCSTRIGRGVAAPHRNSVVSRASRSPPLITERITNSGMAR